MTRPPTEKGKASESTKEVPVLEALTPKESLFNGSAKPGAAPRSRCPLRTPDTPLEPEDAPVHLRGAQRHPHHRPAEDAATARAGAEARARSDPPRRQRPLRLHQAAARQHREERSRALRCDVCDGAVAWRTAHELPDGEETGSPPQGARGGQRGRW